MLNRNTAKGTEADRPLPNADGVYGTYYFCTDCVTNGVAGTYFYSNGERWEAKALDKTDLSPETEAQIICGISIDGSINPIKLDAAGNVMVSGGTGGTGGTGGSGGSGTFIKRSGTIAAAYTSQQVMAANTARKYLFFQNVSDADMYIAFSEAATTSSILVPKNGGAIAWDVFVPTNAVNVLCTIVGKKFTAYEV